MHKPKGMNLMFILNVHFYPRSLKPTTLNVVFFAFDLSLGTLRAYFNLYRCLYFNTLKLVSISCTLNPYIFCKSSFCMSSGNSLVISNINVSKFTGRCNNFPLFTQKFKLLQFFFITSLLLSNFVAFVSWFC